MRIHLAGVLSSLLTCVVIGSAAARPDINVQPDRGPIGPEPFFQAAPLRMEDFKDVFEMTHPGTKVSSWESVSVIYGHQFSQGATAKASAESFIQNSLPIFNVAPDEMVAGTPFPAADNSMPLMYDAATGQYKFTVHYYKQMRDDVEVFRGQVILLTRNEQGNPLVLANSDLRNLGNYRVPAGLAKQVNAGPAIASASQLMPRGSQFRDARHVVWAGYDDMRVQPTLAVEIIGEGFDSFTGTPVAKLFLADAATGNIVYQESMIYDVDVAGSVTGMATTGNAADTCNPEELMAIPYTRINMGANFVHADANGNFTVPNAGLGPVALTAELRSPHFRVVNSATPGGGNTILAMEATPPGPAHFVFNELNDNQFKRAEVNAFIHSNKVRDYALAHHPAYPVIGNEVNFPVNVNLSQTCNAFYSSANQSINFYQSGGTSNCSNTANSTVVHHEYGHRLVNAAGSGQGAYGEGTGDSVAIVLSDDPCLGKGFSQTSTTPPCSPTIATCDGCLRNADNAAQYQPSGCSSCGSGIHACGQLISGCLWSTRNLLAISHPASYRTILGTLFFSSIQLHGTGTTITPAITVHYLTLDDDDANILNGTPHYNQVNGGFSAHNMPGPALGMQTTPTVSVAFYGLAGGPYTPASTTYMLQNVENFPVNYSVETNQPWLTVTPSAGTIPPNTTTNVVVSINSNAGTLPNGLHNAQLAITNHTNNLGNTTRQVTIEIGRLVYPATGLPLTIPDNNQTGATSTINVPETLCVSDLDVQVNVSHTSIGQVSLDLTNPQGVTVRLHNRTGGTADHINKTYNDGVVNVDGPGTLADFNSYISAGTWTLKAIDHASGTTGSIQSWSLRIESAGTICPPVAQDVSVTVPVVVQSEITLSGSSSTNPTFQYIIQTLPGYGSLFDPQTGLITTVPYTLAANSNLVRYKPIPTHAGPDSFTFSVNDGLPSNTATVSIQVGGPQLVHSFNLDSNPDWTATGMWGWGVPCGCGTTAGRLNPAAGFTGSNVYGYNLGGYYTNNMPEMPLTTNAINCSNLSGTSLRFQRWLGVESASFDHAKVQVSNNGSSWTTIWDHTGGSVNPNSWTAVSYDISAVADGQPTVYVRWVMGITDGSVTYQGWNIDDVHIWGIRPPCLADVSGNGVVNIDDLFAVINSWGPCPNCPADVAPPGGNGVVNVDDLFAIINGWGSCP